MKHNTVKKANGKSSQSVGNTDDASTIIIMPTKKLDTIMLITKRQLTKRRLLQLSLGLIALLQCFFFSQIVSIESKSRPNNEPFWLQRNSPPPKTFSSLNGKYDDNDVPKVLMVSFLFGEQAVRKKYLRLFLESARWSGVDLLLLGDHPSSLSLPDNVRHCLVSWEDLVYRVEQRILNGQRPDNLYQTKDYYKISDVRPLFAVLFPELVAGYDWWGHVDNDILLGNFRQFFTPEILNNYDIISPLNNEYTWGPLMLYRNIPLVNELFRKAERPLMEIFDTELLQSFDEWGSEIRMHYNSTMSGLVELYRERLGIRWKGGDIPMVWDGDCLNRTESFPGCCTCHLHPPNASATLQELRQHKLLSMGECGFYRDRLFKSLICHFQYTKEGVEQSLRNDKYVSTLIEHGRIGINFENASGFYPD